MLGQHGPGISCFFIRHTEEYSLCFQPSSMVQVLVLLQLSDQLFDSSDKGLPRKHFLNHTSRSKFLAYSFLLLLTLQEEALLGSRVPSDGKECRPSNLQFLKERGDRGKLSRLLTVRSQVIQGHTPR